jgi:hypothetical protein
MSAPGAELTVTFNLTPGDDERQVVPGVTGSNR